MKVAKASEQFYNSLCSAKQESTIAKSPAAICPPFAQGNGVLKKGIEATANLVDALMQKPLTFITGGGYLGGFAISTLLNLQTSTKDCAKSMALSLALNPLPVAKKILWEDRTWTDYPNIVKIVYKTITSNVPDTFGAGTQQVAKDIFNPLALRRNGQAAQTKIDCENAVYYANLAATLLIAATAAIGTKLLYKAAKPVIKSLYHSYISPLL